MVPTCARCDAPLASNEAPCVQCVLSSAIQDDQDSDAREAASSALSSAPTRKLSAAEDPPVEAELTSKKPDVFLGWNTKKRLVAFREPQHERLLFHKEAAYLQ